MFFAAAASPASLYSFFSFFLYIFLLRWLGFKPELSNSRPVGPCLNLFATWVTEPVPCLPLLLVLWLVEPEPPPLLPPWPLGPKRQFLSPAARPRPLPSALAPVGPELLPLSSRSLSQSLWAKRPPLPLSVLLPTRNLLPPLAPLAPPPNPRLWFSSFAYAALNTQLRTCLLSAPLTRRVRTSAPAAVLKRASVFR
jgi:hypothetical protein